LERSGIKEGGRKSPGRHGGEEMGVLIHHSITAYA